jgi:hypothetical protein
MINRLNRCCTLDASVVECVYRSRVLCLFKILYHKFIFLAVDTIFEVVQTLFCEYLYDDKYKGSKPFLGGSYEGDIVDDGIMTIKGRGVNHWVDGNSYTGDFVDSKRTGKGVYHWANGNSYTGNFVDGKWHGKGVFRWANGNSYYSGDFVDGNMTGKGVYRWANGNSYTGDYVGNKMAGKGVLYWADGNIFEGNFVGDKMTTGQMFLADVNLNLAAEFSGGDAFINNSRLYYLVLKSPDGSVYREGDCTKGQFIAA